MPDRAPVAWEACQTINGSWGYFRDNTLFKTPEMLVRMLVDGVSKGGNLLFNIGPTGRGNFDPVSAFRTGRRHRLTSEAGKRFERTVDPRITALALARVRLGLPEPRVGLLTIGEEAGKGDLLRRQAHPLLAALPGADLRPEVLSTQEQAWAIAAAAV